MGIPGLFCLFKELFTSQKINSINSNSYYLYMCVCVCVFVFVTNHQIKSTLSCGSKCGQSWFRKTCFLVKIDPLTQYWDLTKKRTNKNKTTIIPSFHYDIMGMLSFFPKHHCVLWKSPDLSFLKCGCVLTRRGHRNKYFKMTHNLQSHGADYYNSYNNVAQSRVPLFSDSSFVNQIFDRKSDSCKTAICSTILEWIS